MSVVPARAGTSGRRTAPRNTTSRTLISTAQLNRPGSKVAYRIVLTLVVVVFTLVFIGPLYFLFTDGLKSTQEAGQVPPTLFPAHIHPSTYVTAWNTLSVGRLCSTPCITRSVRSRSSSSSTWPRPTHSQSSGRCWVT